MAYLEQEEQAPSPEELVRQLPQPYHIANMQQLTSVKFLLSYL